MTKRRCAAGFSFTFLVLSEFLCVFLVFAKWYSIFCHSKMKGFTQPDYILFFTNTRKCMFAQNIANIFDCYFHGDTFVYPTMGM